MMMARRTAAGLILTALGIMLTTTSGANTECTAGTRIFSITVFHYTWLDGFDVRCTGGEQLLVPPDYNDLATEQAGGERTEEDICASTAGIQSIEWQTALWNDYNVIQNVSITCMDGLTHTFADRDLFDDFVAGDEDSFSCDDGEYVSGISYEVTYFEDELEEGTLEGLFYVITSIRVMCSSRELDLLCTAELCSGSATLKPEQPEYCALATCSQSECCETIDEDDDQLTADIVTGVVSSVAAAGFIGASAWIFRKMLKSRNNKLARELVNPTASPPSRGKFSQHQ